MKVVVTGAAGKVGRWAVRKLLEAGHEVIASDQKLAEESPAEHFVQADLRDYGQACQLIMGADAVIHLAAIPTDVRNTPQAIFANNMLVNFNVFEACKDWDVPRIVWASSQTVMGFPFTPEYLHYVPIDEEHPVAPRSSYSVGKLLSEHLAGIYHHLARKQIVGLRFSNIYEPDEYYKVPSHWTEAEKEKQKMNLWSYTDARDAAQACLLALQADNLDASVFLIGAADTLMPDPTEELVYRYFPYVPFKRPLVGYEACMSIDKARRVLGYQPQYTWRNVLDDSGEPKAAPEDYYAPLNV
jgi:nucleoside-diphosphate-sugar epimerase